MRGEHEAKVPLFFFLPKFELNFQVLFLDVSVRIVVISYGSLLESVGCMLQGGGGGAEISQ